MKTRARVSPLPSYLGILEAAESLKVGNSDVSNKDVIQYLGVNLQGTQPELGREG